MAILGIALIKPADFDKFDSGGNVSVLLEICDFTFNIDLHSEVSQFQKPHERRNKVKRLLFAAVCVCAFRQNP